MPIFFQHVIDEYTRLGVWHITEDEVFFRAAVPHDPQVKHYQKRLQHLAGRYLLRYLWPEFPSHLIRIADTRKPFIEGGALKFSISHCGSYAAAVVSSEQRVGVDIELVSEKLLKVKDKFLSDEEKSDKVLMAGGLVKLTRLWSAKEAVFKWYGLGKVDFKADINLFSSSDAVICSFKKTGEKIRVVSRIFDDLVLSWTEKYDEKDEF